MARNNISITVDLSGKRKDIQQLVHAEPIEGGMLSVACKFNIIERTSTNCVFTVSEVIVQTGDNDFYKTGTFKKSSQEAVKKINSKRLEQGIEPVDFAYDIIIDSTSHSSTYSPSFNPTEVETINANKNALIDIHFKDELESMPKLAIRTQICQFQVIW